MAMKRKLNIIILLILIFQFPMLINAQDEQKNLMKYWYYRDRLKYFVIPGSKIGESEVAGTRNQMNGLNDFRNIDFGQHGCYFGYYLGILATEYALLIDNGRGHEAQCDYYEATLALNQFTNYMDACEHYYGDCSSEHKYCDAIDGFFVRTAVPYIFLQSGENQGVTGTGIPHLNILNQELTDYDEYNITYPTSYTFGNLPRGHPGWLQDNAPLLPGKNILSSIKKWSDGSYYNYESMSQDEAIGILLGLALLHKYMPSLSPTACEIANRIIKKVSNGNSWIIPYPNNSGGTAGLNALFYSFGFAAAGQYFGYNAFDYIFPGFWFPFVCPDLQTKRIVWEGIATQTSDAANCAMECTLGAIGDSWGAYEFSCQTYPSNSITMGAIYSKCESIFWSPDNDRCPGSWTFYCLLLNRLHPEYSVPDNIRNNTVTLLNSAPGEGPFCYNSSVGNYSGFGWSYSYAWHGTYQENYMASNGTRGNFSGMDYMLLYNMYLLDFGGSETRRGYFPRSAVMLSENWPIEFDRNNILGDISKPQEIVACSYIKSDSKIRNSVRYDYQQHVLPENQQIASPGDISYLAKSIKFLPGFVVEKGAKFSAQVVPHVFWQDSFNQNTMAYGNYGLVNPYDNNDCWGLFDSNINNLKLTQVTDTNENILERKTIKEKENSSNTNQRNINYKIYPNPTSSRVTLDILDEISSKCYITITNTYGVTLIYLQIHDNSTIINLQDFEAGIYFIKIHNSEMETSDKLIKL